MVDNQRYKNLIKGFIFSGRVNSLRDFATKCAIDYPSLSQAMKDKRGFSSTQIRAIEKYAEGNVDSNIQAPMDSPSKEMILELQHLREQVKILKDMVQTQKELSGSAIIEAKDELIANLKEKVYELKVRLSKYEGGQSDNGKSKAL
jgi:tryptophan 2,3-dioxygenase